jgi:hypothetical protein
MLGLAVAFSPATIGEAFAESKFETTQNENALIQTIATPTTDVTQLTQPRIPKRLERKTP